MFGRSHSFSALGESARKLSYWSTNLIITEFSSLGLPENVKRWFLSMLFGKTYSSLNLRYSMSSPRLVLETTEDLSLESLALSEKISAYWSATCCSRAEICCLFLYSLEHKISLSFSILFIFFLYSSICIRRSLIMCSLLLSLCYNSSI